jgi:hypothetical protein
VVVIDEAVGETHYGGVICAPVFKEIMESSLRKDRAVVPSGCVLMSKPKASGLAVVGAAAQRTSFQLDATNHPESPVYPSVVGLTLREAARLLAQNSIRWRSSGSGTVVKQHPVAYAPMDERRLCRLVLSEVR